MRLQYTYYDELLYSALYSSDLRRSHLQHTYAYYSELCIKQKAASAAALV